MDVLFLFTLSQAIKSTTDEKVEEVYNIFNSELKMVNKELNQRKGPFSDHMPRIAGHTHWVLALRHRIDRSMEVSPLDYTVFYFF